MSISAKKLNRTFNYIVLFFVLFTLGFYLLSVIKRYPLEKDILKDYAFVLGILCMGMLTCMVDVVSGRIKTDKASTIFIFGLSLVMLFVWNHFIKAVPVSDYRVLWEGASQIADGTFQNRAIRKDDYFCFYNYQIAYAFYLSLLIRLFHGSLVAVKCVNAIVMALTNVVLYKTLRLFSDQRASLCGTLLFMGWPYIFMGSGILNNQHEAMLFEALAVYMFLKYSVYGGGKNVFCKWIICAVFLSIAEIMRPTAFVIIIAIIILFILQFILKGNKNYLINGGIVFVSYLVITNIFNSIFIFSGLAPYGIKSSNLWFKVSLGLTGTGITAQSTTDAEHTNLYYDLAYYGFDYDAYKKAAAIYVKKLIKSGSINFEFVLNRIVYFAGAVDNQYLLNGTNFHIQHRVIVNVLHVMGICIYFMSVFFSGIRCIFRRIMDRDEISLPALIFCGYFIVYVFFETQTRYRYEQYYMLFLMGVPAMATVWRKLKQYLEQEMKIMD